MRPPAIATERIERDASSSIERGLSLALYVALAAFVAVSVHTFFAYIDHYPYWSIDDGLAVISTSLLQTGRYGDPSVPIEELSRIQRYRGFFIYGPWYFLSGSAVIWLIGFSVKALRALHLFAALSLVLVSRRLFVGLRGAIATTLIGVGVSDLAVHVQWPMVRPDAFVSLFAAGLVWSAARAIRTRRPRDWFVCGLAAGCGALTHLVGASLIPASAAALLAGVAVTRRVNAPAGGWAATLTRPLIALAAGWLGAAVMFYASFGFRISEHVGHLLRYRAAVRATTEGLLASAGPGAVWSEHFRIATSGVPAVYLALLALALVVACALVVRALLVADERAIETIALVAPGLIVFVLYVFTLGFYPNFHTGYVILPQLVGVWLMASTGYVVLGDIGARAPVGGRVIQGVLACAILALVSASAYAAFRSDDDPRLALARSWIDISAYRAEVLGPIPRGAVAWGADPFAVEGPDRIQLISMETALEIVRDAPPERRAALTPDYLVWGHPQNQRTVAVPSNDPDDDPVTALRMLEPDAEFALASLVSAAPYGVTRVYERRVAGVTADRPPLVSAWDAGLQRWLHDAAAVEGVAWRAARGELDVTRGPRTWKWNATDAVTADLPADWYLVRVALAGSMQSRQMVTAGGGSAHDYLVGDLPPPVDVAARLAPGFVYLLRRHDGGPMGINLYAEDARARIGEVTLFRVSGFADYRLAREELAEQPLPPLTAWHPDTGGGVTAVASGAALTVNGNGSQWGYQLVSPRIEVTPGAHLSVRLPIAQEAGRVCTGILDERQQTWLARPIDQAERHRLDVGPNHAVFVVIANCNADGAKVASRFTVSGGRYAATADRWYVDTLMREFTNRPSPARIK